MGAVRASPELVTLGKDGRGEERFTSRDMAAVEARLERSAGELGMIGSRQMERVVSAADDAGAKLVLVGDPQQLQAIEAGAAFRSIAERHGAVEITEIRRQRDDWQRDATRQLATGRTGEAIDAYDRRGMVRATDTRENARDELIDGWDRQRQCSHTSARRLRALARRSTMLDPMPRTTSHPRSAATLR